MDTKIFTASDFFDITNKVYKVAGWDYNLHFINAKNKLRQEIYFWGLNGLFILIYLQCSIAIHKNLETPDKFLDVTEEVLCIGFATMMFMKSYFVVYRNRKVLTEMIDELDDVIPKEDHLQDKYRIQAYHSRFRNVSLACSIIYSSLFAIFNIMPILQKIFGSFFGIQTEWELPFKFYYPFDVTQDYIYPVMYIYESWLCGKCAIEVLGSDLIFCNITSLVTMRLEILKQEILEIDVKDHRMSLEKLKEFIRVHQHLIRVNDQLEELYSFSLLGDILASTIITCIAAFNTFVSSRLVLIYSYG